jgi:predicted metalloprotease
MGVGASEDLVTHGQWQCARGDDDGSGGGGGGGVRVCVCVCVCVVVVVVVVVVVAVVMAGGGWYRTLSWSFPSFPHLTLTGSRSSSSADGRRTRSVSSTSPCMQCDVCACESVP